MSARKDDTGKPPLSLIPRSALLAEARVMAKGKSRYGANNWRSGDGLAWSRVIDAALRHILAFADGEDYDNGEGGSGELHLANARCCLAFLIEYYEKGLGTDDRYKKAATTHTAPIYEVWVTGGTTPDLRIGVYPTRAAAEKAVTHYTPEFPTFKVYTKEVKEQDNGY